MSTRHVMIAFATCLLAFAPAMATAQTPRGDPPPEYRTMPSQTLTERQQAILPIAAFTASGNVQKLDAALNAGLDAGLTVNEIKEIIGQLYAYVGFPRSLNGLGQFMKTLEARKARGIDDPQGKEPSVLPQPEKMLATGTANQTKLSGAPVKGPLFEFSPQIDRYLKEHLFGPIFARDNLGWPERELATVGAIAMLPGAESQLASHMRISRNVGLGEAQLQHVVRVLRDEVGPEAGSRAEAAREQSNNASK